MPSATTQPAPPTLTLPASHFAKLAPASYLATHLSANPSIRSNGRSTAAFRTPQVTTSSLSHATGSAVVRCGDTSVVCAINAETLLARDIPDPPRTQNETAKLAGLNLLAPNVELATGCSPNYLPGSGGPPSTTAQSLSYRLLRLLLSSKLVQLKDLEIAAPQPHSNDDANEDDKPSPEGPVAHWSLHISLLVLSLSGSHSVFDVLWGALVAALRDVRLPRAWWDADNEMIICSDRASEARRLSLRGTPIACTWACFVTPSGMLQTEAKETDAGDGMDVDTADGVLSLADRDGKRAWVLADPDDFEESVVSEFVSVVVDCGNGEPRLLQLSKSGGGVVGKDAVAELVRAAAARWKVWTAALPG